MNGLGYLGVLSGLVLAWFSAVALAIAIPLRRNTDRPWKSLTLALVVIGACLFFCNYLSSGPNPTFVEFAWNRSTGFTRFDVLNYNPVTGLGARSDNPAWKLLVRMQTEPEIRQFTRNGWPRIEGRVVISVWRVIPFAHPTALGSGGANFWNPDDPRTWNEGSL